jgi:hypothetical protein
VRFRGGKTSLDVCSNVLHQHVQVQLVRRRFLKAVLHVPRFSVVILGVDEKHVNTDDVSGINASEENILEKRTPYALSLMHAVNGKAGQQHRRNVSRLGPLPPSPELTHDRRLPPLSARVFVTTEHDQRAVVGYYALFTTPPHVSACN